MNAWAITDKGIVRKQNQDAFFVCCDDEKKIALLAVCDGMGGAAAGNVASQLALDVFTSCVKDHLTGDMRALNFPEIFSAAIQEANTAVFTSAMENVDYRGMGTTLVAAVVTEDQAFVANVGDSRAYWIDRQGITQITRDHSIVEDMVERGDITREQARSHPNKNLITRALGTSNEVFPDIFSILLGKGEYLFLCSDGLSNLVQDQEIYEEVTKGESIAAACDRLLQIAMQRGAPDNITSVLFEK